MASSTDVMKNVSTQYPGYSDLTPGRVISRAQLLQFLSCYHTGEQLGLSASFLAVVKTVMRMLAWILLSLIQVATFAKHRIASFVKSSSYFTYNITRSWKMQHVCDNYSFC